MSMIEGTITKIHPTSWSKKGGKYRRIEFELEDGSWAHTYIYQGMGNVKNWKEIAKEGNRLGNLKLKRKNLIDADSKPIII